MWSLPDIKRMNAAAKVEAPSLEQQARTGIGPDGEPLECECKGWGRGEECDEKLRHYLWFDIFSDDPKGVLTLCERHDGYFGSPTEGYFECYDCNRVMVENYTWERYDTVVDGDQLCLPCAAARYIADDENWIELTDENIAAVDFERVRTAKHVIGVEMPIPKGIKFFDNAEFDSGNGQQISGSDLKDLLGAAKDEGYTKALLILDAAYQFAVSIGVYVSSV
jgi:hypothetical protein